MSKISFKTKLYKINSWTIVHLPKEASAKLPSRGMTMIEGTINGIEFKMPLEPDGKGSHWFRLDNSMLKNAKAAVGDTVALEIEPTKEWVSPDVPDDFKKALASAPEAHSLFEDVTPNAQWDWIRWIRATNVAETRKHRIEVACSKLKKGMRRPCCFNRNACTEPAVSHNWILLVGEHKND